MKSNWPITQLGSLIRQVSVKNKNAKDTVVYSVTNSEGFVKSTDYFNKEVFSKNTKNYKVVRKYQFAYNPSRINVGSIDYLKEQTEVLVSPLYICFETSNELDNEYLLKYLMSGWGNLQIQSNTEGAVRDSLKYKGLEKIKLPLPLVNDQIRIVKLLSRVEALISTRKDKLYLLDEFLKSTFLEMFGDPAFNRKKLSVKKFGDYIEYIGDIGSNGSNANVAKNLVMHDLEDYAVMIRTVNLNSNDFTNKVKYISKDTYDYFAKSKIYGGEIIMNKIGSAGKFWIMPNLNRPVSLGLNQFVIRLKNLNTFYLYYYLSTNYSQVNIKSRARGAATLSITKSAVKSLPLMYPPIDLQNKFAAIVEKVKCIESLYKKSLTELENLYGTLSQKAFKGELDLSKIPIDVVQTGAVETAIESLSISNTTVKSTSNDFPTLDSKAQEKIIRQLTDSFLSAKEDISTTIDELLHYINSNLASPIQKSDEVLNIIGYDKVKKWLFKIQENDKTNQLNASQYLSERSGMVSDIAASIGVNLGSVDMPMSDTKIREKIISQLFESFLSEKQNSTLSFDQLWQYIDSNLVDLIQEPEEELDSNDYDKVKNLVFEKLNNKKIVQRFNMDKDKRKIVLDVTG